MPESVFTRLWNAVKPPPPAHCPDAVVVTQHKRRQRRLIMISLGVVAMVGAGAWGYSYVSSAPQRADKEFQEGMKFMRPGQYQTAVQRFGRALDISPQLTDAYLERAVAHRYLNEPEPALADFERALDLNPSLARAHTGIGMIYLDKRDTRRAFEEFNKSISIDPNADAYYQRGQIHSALGNHKEAIADYDKAIEEMRDSPFVYRARALAKQNAGDIEGAHADREQADTLEGRRPR